MLVTVLAASLEGSGTQEFNKYSLTGAGEEAADFSLEVYFEKP